ncbi:MAG: radical SAM protein [Candidatus Omnitrophota bacterium]|nr:radical SAM protein [Candidatus Omnitrophota bacterium]
MKIIIAYPPLGNAKGIPLLSQNRQFQYFQEPTFIYPVVPASAAALLQEAGYEVIWLDCIAEDISYNKFIEIIQKEKPDLIAFETKTPVIKQHWKIINEIKELTTFVTVQRSEVNQGVIPAQAGIQRGYDRMDARFHGHDKNGRRELPEAELLPTLRPCLGKANNQRLTTVLFGDHVTALPEESFQNSLVDFVLTGGDYDFLLLNLCNALNYKHRNGQTCELKNIQSALEPGIYYRENGQIKNSGKFQLNHDLDSLPFIDRTLSKWQSYAYKNGNFKRTPGTYIMSGRDCWYHACTFCSWPTLYPQFRSRKVGNVLDEIGLLIEKYNVREIMDDTGTFPVGDWLKEFCCGMIQRGYNKKIYLDCNMRFGNLKQEDFALMKKAGFRLLLFGLESANQDTLDRLDKGLKIEDILKGCYLARKTGLFPHITIMFGYPWETYEDALNTLKLGRQLLRKGYAYTMQATLVIPYPGSLLFKECKENGLLKTLDWDKYDMKQPIMSSFISDEKVMELVQGMYRMSFNPEFILRKLFSLRDTDDLKYFFRAAKKVLGHIWDFKKIRSTIAQQRSMNERYL